MITQLNHLKRSIRCNKFKTSTSLRVYRSQYRVNITHKFSTTSIDENQSYQSTPITIIGGGPSGLLLSILLSSYNVPSTLFERKTESQLISHPQAHFINLRTMEILRHNTNPKVTQKLWEAVPPIEQWQDFRFGHSVLGSDDENCLGIVRHPVENGGHMVDGGKAILMERSRIESLSGYEMNDEKLISKKGNSICKVAHLGQHKFCSILIDEAKRAATKVTNGRTTLNFNHNVSSVQDLYAKNSKVNVSKISSIHKSSPLLIHYSGEQTNSLLSDFVVATEGAHSSTREQYGISMIPNPHLDPQHLINVHFKVTSSELTQKLSEHPAMLYFIYNEVMISVFICHDMEEGNWVVQIPYMPPYQSPPSEEECSQILFSGLIGVIDPQAQALSFSSNCFEIISIRPWVMTASIAEEYILGSSRRIILAGDSAHTFPPAGGFGMNTGLQDVHNLAWRLALQYHWNNNQTGLKGNVLHTNLKRYELERRSIAEQNSSLSVRNYNRTLGIAQTLGLDIRLAQFAKHLFSNSLADWIPMSAKKNIFENSFKLALQHLSWFKNGKVRDGNILRNSMIEEMRNKLRKGEGLPLIFPRFELGFRYGKDFDESGDMKENYMERDIASYIPSLQIGCRMPNCIVEISSNNIDNVTKSWPNLIVEHTKSYKMNNDGEEEKHVITLTDISSQIRQNQAQPCFSILFMAMNKNKKYEGNRTNVKQVIQDIQEENNISIQFVEIQNERNQFQIELENISENHLVVNDIDLFFHDLIMKYFDDKMNNHDIMNHKDCVATVLIRPDGHIANISCLNATKDGLSSLKNETLQSFEKDCGIIIQK